MQKKFILVPLVASVLLIALMAVSLTVFALAVDPAAAQTERVVIEAAPVLVQPAVIETQVKYQGGYMGGGCDHSAKMQLTHKSTQETPNDQLLTQVEQ
jgi:opacity protein-like surface antigen